MKQLPHLKLIITVTFFFVSGFCCYTSAAQNTKLTTEKHADWVTTTPLTNNSKQLEEEAEEGYLYLDYEIQVSMADRAHYIKSDIKILSDAGVQNSSEISVNFDPKYERVIFHSINIIRDGRIINKLQLSKFKVIQQEKELDKHLYNGSLTALLELDDVRKGDIIESSYTIKGFNPIYNNKYFDTYSLNFGVPIASIYYKLLVPQGHTVIIKNSNCSIAPSIGKTAQQTIYEWKDENIKPLHLENKIPQWYNPYSTIMVSEFIDWKDVNMWANNLYPRNVTLSADFQKKIDDIKKTCLTDEQRTLAALHFVQDNVRYMGIEMGENSNKPSNPNKIFSQRFGDCKDKSYLLVTMLQAMNITANPVLINTTARLHIEDLLPSPDCFDHCTVQVIIKNTTYWFDPTIAFQGGDISSLSYPDYKKGLVITPATTALTSIPFHERGTSETQEIFTIPDLTGQAKLKVITNFTGFMADDMRSDFKNNSMYELKKKYKDFYGHFFEKVISDSLTYNDYDSTGNFRTTEYYTLSKIWKTDKNEKKLELSSYIINSIMKKPEKERKMPFSIEYPANYKERLELDMPEDWPVDGFNKQISSAGFTFSANARSVSNMVLLDYQYESLKDNISPEESSDFFTKFNEADDATGYELNFDMSGTASVASSHKSSSTSGGDPDIFTKLYTVLALAVVITLFIKKIKQKSY